MFAAERGLALVDALWHDARLRGRAHETALAHFVGRRFDGLQWQQFVEQLQLQHELERSRWLYDGRQHQYEHDDHNDRNDLWNELERIDIDIDIDEHFLGEHDGEHDEHNKYDEYDDCIEHDGHKRNDRHDGHDRHDRRRLRPDDRDRSVARLPKCSQFHRRSRGVRAHH
jgi:hypothetical protein